MLNLWSYIAFPVMVILACSVFATTGNSIVISYAQIDSPSNIAPLMPSPYSSAGFNNNNNNNSQTTSAIRTGPNIDNQQQLQQQLNSSLVPLSIKITSHTQNQTVPVNKPLRIYGISSDSANSNCLVYADWNDSKPMLKANASGPNGLNDYSNWTFTYTSKYHLITEGTNELTSKLDCGGSSVKYFTVNVTGVGQLLPPLSSPNNENNNNNGPLPISLTTDTDRGKDNNDDNNDDENRDIDEVSSNNNKDSISDGDSDIESDNQKSGNIDNKEHKEKGKDKKEKKNTPSDESKKNKGPKGKNK